MKEKILYALWACLYILCAGLGTAEHAEGLGKLLFMLSSLIFFLPGVALLVLGYKEKAPKICTRVFVIATVSLSLTLALLVVNFLCVSVSAQTGKLLNDLLLLVSVPMFCAQNWVLSLFVWACLLYSALSVRKSCVNNS